MVNLEITRFKAISFFFLMQESILTWKEKNQLGESSPNFIFAVVNLYLIILEKKCTVSTDRES